MRKFKLVVNNSILARFRALSKKITVSILLLAIIILPSLSFAIDLKQMIAQAEQRYLIPSGLLAAIAKVESNFKPYAINISGKTIFASSKSEAEGVIWQNIDQGITNIDLGVMQVNLYWHGKHFSSIAQMLEPKNNIEYAAQFLSKLYQQHGSWSKAVRHYHSANASKHVTYSRKVLISWLGN